LVCLVGSEMCIRDRSALGGHDVAFREYDVCVNGVTRKAILWGSLPY
jgi:hypothetical protein